MRSGWDDQDPMGPDSLLSLVTHPEGGEDALEPRRLGIPQTPTPKISWNREEGPPYSFTPQIRNTYSARGFDPTEIRAQLEESLLVKEENILQCKAVGGSS